MKTVKIKRLFNEIVSVRDYVIRDCMDSNIPLRLELEGTDEYMILFPDDMEDKQFQINKRTFQSKFDADQEYTLLDYTWRPKQ